MDIWAWVVDAYKDESGKGNRRLSQLIFDIPRLVTDLEHDAVDALVPEAVSLARAARSPWLEVYFRHWHLQSRVIHRHAVNDALPEAVALLDFANRPATKDCPQSVCVVQDLACTYGDIDGPGFVPERLAVAQEALDRIDPTWPCWDCISGEYGDALQDDGDAQALLDFAERQIRAVELAGASVGHNLQALRADGLLAVGRAEEALEQALAIESHRDSSVIALRRDILLSRCNMALGRTEEALEHLPKIERLDGSPGYFLQWLEAAIPLFEKRKLDNDPGLGSRVAEMAEELTRNGARFGSGRLLVHAAHLAHLRGARAVCRRLLDRATARLPELRRPDRLSVHIDAVRDALAADPVTPLPPSLDVDALLDDLGADPDANLERLGAARERWPDDLRLVAGELRTLMVCGLASDAVAEAERWFEAHPDDPNAYGLLGAVLRDAEETTRLEAHIQRGLAVPAHHVQAQRLRVASLMAARNHAAARDALTAILDASPDGRVALDDVLALARCHRLAGEPELGLARLEPLLEHLPPGHIEWEVMLSATLVERWPLVRTTAARIGIELEGEGPIELSGEVCLLQYGALDNVPEAVARRTGPVTARVVGIAGEEGRRETYGDLVLIEPAPLTEPLVAEDGTKLYTYPVVAILGRGQYHSFEVDGLRPEPQEFETLLALVESLGGELQDRTAPSYRFIRDGELFDGFFGLLAVPTHIPLERVHQELEALCGGFERPLTWPGLATAAGQREAAERQLRSMADWGG